MKWWHRSIIRGLTDVCEVMLCYITTEISSTGAAVIDTQSSTASITVEASNDPHGVFSIASSSLNLELTEDIGTDGYLVIDRKFGSIGMNR